MNARPALLLLALTGAGTIGSASCKGCDAVSMQANVEATASAPRRTGISVELKFIRGQIELHRRMNGGANPPSLQAMDTLPHLKYPDEYNYDPTTGVVSATSFPEL